MSTNKTVIALPKGRILEEALPMLTHAGIEPEDSFFDSKDRKLHFGCKNRDDVELIRVRSFDVATYVAFGAADLGIAGRDVILEFDYPGLYAPIDLGIGPCRMVVAALDEHADEDITAWSHIRVATKYPEIAKRYFASRGIQAECIKLSGAMELAPVLGLCKRIVDLVSSGDTLRANGLKEIEHIADISAHLVVNRIAFKTKNEAMTDFITKFREAVDAPPSA